MFIHTHSKRSLAGVSIALAVLLSGVVEVQAEFTFGEPENLGPVVNSAYRENGPTITADGLTIFFFSNRPGGEGVSDLWTTTRTSLSEPWQTPVNLGSLVNTSSGEWSPSVSADGLLLYFSSNRSGGSGSGDLWATMRISTTAPWQTPVNLGTTVNSSRGDYSPNISPDGLALFFASNRPGGSSALDLWMATRVSVSDPWNSPSNLGPTVNSSSDESGSTMSSDGLTLFFGSPRPGGEGAYDGWMTTRSSTFDPWKAPVNPGPPVNSSFGDGHLVPVGGSTFLFVSDRPGSYGDYDLWQVAVIPDCPGDLDGDGVIGLGDLATLLPNYGDPGPFTYEDGDLDGDGDVDIEDLAALLAVYGNECW